VEGSCRGITVSSISACDRSQLGKPRKTSVRTVDVPPRFEMSTSRIQAGNVTGATVSSADWPETHGTTDLVIRETEALQGSEGVNIRLNYYPHQSGN
jgi:hypothetical protein